jgi:tetratricopeptide (TPR) repeat protein
VTWRRWLSARVVLLAVAGGLSAPYAVAATDAEPRFSLRVRGARLCEVIWLLAHVTGQDYVTDADVVGRVDLDLTDVTRDDVERLLSARGLSFTTAGSIRRASIEPTPELALPGTGHPTDFGWIDGEVRDILRLFMDIKGEEIVAPAGDLGWVSLVARERPTDDALEAVLASAGLTRSRDGDRLLVRRRDDPTLPLLPLSGEAVTGLVAYRHGEGAVKARRPGMEGFLSTELALWGFASGSGRRMAATRLPDGRPVLFETGQKLFDGRIEAIDADGATVRTDLGASVRWTLPAPPDSYVPLPDDLAILFDRARAARGAHRYDEAQRHLAAAAGRTETEGEGQQVRAALADLHFASSRPLVSRGAMEAGIRRLESALEIDRVDRPWQAAEDLNEIGKAWTAIGEPERAVKPHQEALEIAVSGAVRDAPRPFACVRPHERTPWVEGDALDGLANAERVRGRLAEAAALYERALKVWKSVDDPTGLAAALTGLGLVRHDQGRPADAARLHEQALTQKADHPVVRAVVLNNLGVARLGLKQLDAAWTSFDESLAIYRRLQDRAGEGAVLNNLGAYWEARSDTASACDSYGRALAVSREADDRRGEAITRRHLERLLAAGPLESTRLCASSHRTFYGGE